MLYPQPISTQSIWRPIEQSRGSCLPGTNALSEEGDCQSHSPAVTEQVTPSPGGTESGETGLSSTESRLPMRKLGPRDAVLPLCFYLPTPFAVPASLLVLSPLF